MESATAELVAERPVRVTRTESIDISKLYQLKNYAKKIGKCRKTIYNWRKLGKITLIEIDGKIFVYEN